MFRMRRPQGGAYGYGRLSFRAKVEESLIVWEI